MYLQENSLNPKQFFAKLDQGLCKIRPNVRKYVKIMNIFAAIYIAGNVFLEGLRGIFWAMEIWVEVQLKFL